MAEDAQEVTLAWYVQALGADEMLATASEAEATELVTALVGASNPYKVPASVISRAVLEVGANLYHRKSSNNGIVSFTSPDGMESGMRITRDPLSVAFPLLRPYMPMGLA